jgi:uncharacterized protein (TIGR03086 family)
MESKQYQDLFERALRDTADMLDRVGQEGWDAPSPCAGWTVRQTGNHLAGGLAFLTRIVDGDRIDPAEQGGAEVDHLGSDPAESLRAIGKRTVAVFGAPGVLDRVFALPPDMPGIGIANICLLETLVHGWDIASGAGVTYRPDAAVVAAVRDYSATITGPRRRADLFGPPVPTAPEADPFAATLGQLGRQRW